jgi:hypothetical protein
MEERHRDDGFEATFVVSTTRPDAWQRLRDATPARDWVPGPEPDQWWIPGVEGPGDELEVVHEKRLHVRKAAFPCEGSEIVITMEDAETGTRITFVQNGFGPDFPERRPWLESGWWCIRADLFVYFEHGIAPGRHLRPWVGIGCDVAETAGGLTVASVSPGGAAAQAGVHAGDLLLTVAGAPVVTIRELSILARSLRNGQEATFSYLRDRGVRKGAGTL